MLQELSVRAQDALEKAGITTIEELCEKTEMELLRLRNFGRKSLTEVRMALRKSGKSLATNRKAAAKPYVICRTNSAGAFAGTLETRDGKECTLSNARRLWYWAGAASLSQLAMAGTSKPSQCKFPCAVSQVTLTETIEILSVSDVARASIEAVPVWEA